MIDELLKNINITPNVMQQRVLSRLFSPDFEYKRAYIMGGSRSGKTTLVSLIAYCYVKSYYPVINPLITIVLLNEKDCNNYINILEDVLPFVQLIPIDILFNADTPKSTLYIIDNPEMIELKPTKEFINKLDYFIKNTNVNIILIGGFSEFLVNLMLNSINDNDIFVAHYSTWAATGQSREEFIERFIHIPQKRFNSEYGGVI